MNLYDAVRRTIGFTSPEGKEYALRDDAVLPTIVLRPRGWHLDERHLLVDGGPRSARWSTSGSTSSTTPHELLARGSGPYFYLPKMESHLEARLWNDVFTDAQEHLGVPRGTIRATVLIETIPAAFEMDEILYELREHISGLNAGRWDYLFSIIKNFRDAGPRFTLPDRVAVTMTAPMMRAYTELLVQTCHRRGAFAMGGMAAFIPSRRDEEVNEVGVREGPRGQGTRGGDGFRRLVGGAPRPRAAVPRGVRRGARRPSEPARPAARRRARSRPRTCSTVDATPGDGHRSRACAATSRSALQYLEAWLRGNGAVAIDNLMEDAATAEISRSQVWQWIHNGVRLDDRHDGHRRPGGGADRGRGTRRCGSGSARRSWTAAGRRRAQALRTGRARRRLRRLPDPARVRPDRWRRRVHERARRSVPSAPTWTRGSRRPTGPAPSGTPETRTGRQPVHTVYVPADRVRRRPRPGLGQPGAGGARRPRRTRPRPRRPARPAGGPVRRRCRGGPGAGGAQARARADRGPAGRLRGRLRRPGRRERGP